MLDRDWTGTAAAVTALALTAGVWLWPQAETPPPAAERIHALAVQDDLARWQDEARRWDGLGDSVQISSAGAAEAAPPVVR